MTRIRIVNGNYRKFTEGNHNMYAKGNIITNANGTITEKGEQKGIIYGDPESPPPLNLINYYVKVRLKDPSSFDGSFAFDWVDVNPSTEEIEKIQGVDFSNVEYFYKEPKRRNTKDLGEIVEATQDIDTLKDTIERKYKGWIKNCKNGTVDKPYILLPAPDNGVNYSFDAFSLEVNVCEGELLDETIYIESDSYYRFEIIGGKTTDQKTEKKISSNKELLTLSITCLKDSPEKTYWIKQKSAQKQGITVGGFTMMENKLLTLKFRVIALVSSDGVTSAKARNLFRRFKEAGIKDYLNKNSLNQAGYNVEIENQTMFDNLDNQVLDLDEYLYAFDKETWRERKYFASIPTDSNWWEQNNESRLTGFKDVIVMNQKDVGGANIENGIDMKTIEYYKYKLFTKQKSCDDIGFIILCDFDELEGNTGAFSRTFPLNFNSLFIFNINLVNQQSYSHELGHMMGLGHIFFTEDEKNQFDQIQDRLSKESEALLNIRQNEYTQFEGNIGLKSKTIVKLNRFIHFASLKIKDSKSNYEKVQEYKNNIVDNQIAIRLLKEKKGNQFESMDWKMWLLKEDGIEFYREYIDYCKKWLKQVKNNYLLFKKCTTKNIMDYNDNKICFLHNQIKIMRDDFLNYSNVPNNN